jgi:hypothetical protein
MSGNPLASHPMVEFEPGLTVRARSRPDRRRAGAPTAGPGNNSNQFPNSRSGPAGVRRPAEFDSGAK